MLPLLHSGRSPLTGGPTLTFDLTQTDLPSSTAVYAYVVGLVSAAHDTYYRLDSSGTPHVMQYGDNSNAAGTFPGMSSLSVSARQALAPNYPVAWADYSIPLTVGQTTVVSLAGINTTNMPELGTGTAAFSGRIFLSVGVPKLPITPTGSGTVAGGTGATGWTSPIFTAAPGYLTLYDWIEFSFDSAGNFDGNTTQVNQFGFPLGLSASPLSVGQAVTLPFSSSREVIISDLSSISMYSGSASALVPVPAAAASAFPTTTSNVQITNLRVVSPNTLVTENCYLGPLAWYFSDTIRQWYANWQTSVLQTHDTASGWYTGFVPTSGSLAGVLVFYQGQLTISQVQQNLANGQMPDIILTGKYGNPVTTNATILSADILACENTLNGGNVVSTTAAASAAKNVCKMIAAAFNRGVMSNLLDDGSCPASFYPGGPGAPPWNQWAQKVHSYNSSGLAYGFAYDDLCNQSTSIQSNPLQNCTISLGKFG